MAPDPAPRGQTWQLPIFALGVVALGAALWAFPPQPDRPVDQYERQLAELRSALAQKSTDPAILTPLITAVEAHAEDYPQLTTEAHYLAGSGHDRLAEQSPADAAEWAQAAAQFTRVQADQLAPAERANYLYRRAKAEAATGQGDPKAIIEALALAPAGEDDLERHRLLAETLWRMPSPNLAQIKRELSTYLQGASRLSSTAKAELKEKLAGVHLALNEPDAARNWLKDLGPDAPPLVKALAESRLGLLAANEGRSLDAAGHFEQSLVGDLLPPSERTNAQYRAGVAWLKQKDLTKAKAFLEAAANSPGAAAQAARVRLAELALRETPNAQARQQAVEHLRAAVAGVTAERAFDNPYVTLEELRNVFEQAVQVTGPEANPELATSAAASYAAIAAPHRAAEVKADALLAWATKLQLVPAMASEATAKFRSAAAEYTALAKSFPTPTGQAEYLRKASKCHRYAGDDAAAVEVMKGIESLTGVPDDVLTAAWVERGEALVAVQDFKAGTKALREAVEKAAPAAAAQARVKLAVAHVDQAKQLLKTSAGKLTEPIRLEAKGLTKLAADLLEEVSKQPVDSPGEKESQQLALFELGKIRLAQGELVQAEERFRKLMTAYPQGTWADQARLYLGCTLLQLGRGDHQGDQPPANATALLTEAAQLFEQLGKCDNTFLQTQADIRLANTLFLLKRFDELPPLADRLTKKYAGTAEELIVLSLQYSAERQADQPQQAAATFARTDAAYAKLKDSAFTGQSEEYTRDFWTRWLAQLKESK